jgi:RNA polymerase sigma-70 factor, ECF subfamily
LHDHRTHANATELQSPSHARLGKRPVAAALRDNARAAFGRAARPSQASRSVPGVFRPGPAAAPPAATDRKFREDLIALIPNLRAFGITLAGRKDGEDLAQEALAKAWANRARYEAGTNLKAWAFTILRNHFYSGKRRDWRTQPLDPGVAESVLISLDDAPSREELVDVRNAMQLLPDDQREALILAGPAGLSYDETAKICGCAIGTVKSRVSRARAALVELMAQMETGRRSRTDISAAQAFDNIMQQAADLQRRTRAAP